MQSYFYQPSPAKLHNLLKVEAVRKLAALLAVCDGGGGGGVLCVWWLLYADNKMTNTAWIGQGIFDVREVSTGDLSGLYNFKAVRSVQKLLESVETWKQKDEHKHR